MPDSPSLDVFLLKALRHGFQSIGQVAVLPSCSAAEITPDTRFCLCHEADQETAIQDDTSLELFDTPESARRIALENDAGEYRPLHSSPDLRRGWILHVEGVQNLRLALDFLYPAAIGMWLAHRNGSLEDHSFRDKLARQTGMYRSANRISNTRAQQLLRRLCDPKTGCLKKILWKIDATTPVSSLPPEKFDSATNNENYSRCPLLCQEACNIAVAEARKEARKEVIVVPG